MSDMWDEYRAYLRILNLLSPPKPNDKVFIHAPQELGRMERSLFWYMERAGMTFVCSPTPLEQRHYLIEYTYALDRVQQEWAMSYDEFTSRRLFERLQGLLDAGDKAARDQGG